MINLIKQKGLALKTFIYTFTLITLVIIVSFGTLYFMLPNYYLRQKSKTLEKNANALEINLNQAESVSECAELISSFARANNSNIIAFDLGDSFIPELSSPFLLMNDAEIQPITFAYAEIKQNDNGGTDKMKVIAKISNELQEQGGIAKNQVNAGTIDSDGTAFFIQREHSNAVIMRSLKNDLIGYITISSTLQPIDEAKNVLISLIPYLLALNFIIALAAAYLFANQLTKPILKISNAAAMMQEMKPGILSNVRTDDELGQLSLNLDSLYLNLCENIQSLQLEMDKAAKLERSKTDFMRSAGHELKTPIAALNGIVEGMIDNVGAYKNREKYLNESKGQITKLAKLVNEILMSSQLEHIDESILFEDIDVGDILEEASAMYEILIEKKRLHVTKDISNFIYNTDSHVLLNTLSNLISNAVNYTEPEGKIIMTLIKGNDCNILSIENQCQNIDDELIPKLFEPFFTLDYSRHKAKSGTGLGLYIVNKNLNALKLPFKVENTKIGLKFSIIFKKPID